MSSWKITSRTDRVVPFDRRERVLSETRSRIAPSEAKGTAGASESDVSHASNESPKAPRNELLTTQEAADILRLSPRTLERFRVQGIGPKYVKLGPGKRARVAYRRADLASWIGESVFASTSEYEAD